MNPHERIQQPLAEGRLTADEARGLLEALPASDPLEGAGVTEPPPAPDPSPRRTEPLPSEAAVSFQSLLPLLIFILPG
jgi:hypothetical protein